MGIIHYTLLPFSLLYYLAGKVRYHILQRPQKIDAKVICVGNALIGGSGKTPIVSAIAKILLKKKKKVAIISHGYKGSLLQRKMWIKVNPDLHSCCEVGDEALLLSKIAPTYIAKKRIIAARIAAMNGAEIVILDDGLQNNSIYKDLIILAVNKFDYNNKFLIPTGPFRESFESCVKKSDALAMPESNYILENLSCDKPRIFYLEKVKNSDQLFGKSVILLIGIARPERLKKILKSLDIRVIESYIFSDHHKFTLLELKEIYNKAKSKKCKVLTTEKDYVRLPKSFKKRTEVIEYELEFVNKNTILSILNKIL